MAQVEEPLVNERCADSCRRLFFFFYEVVKVCCTLLNLAPSVVPSGRKLCNGYNKLKELIL